MFSQDLQGLACNQDEGNFIETERSIGHLNRSTLEYVI